MTAARALAIYASIAHASRGRLYLEPESSTRTAFQRDRDRIIHCTAFRRLKHKTQVFVSHEGDHYRTRLTHSLEVAQIARSICRYLALDDDLAEALALAHDLGHPPFGHAGEEALDAAMRPYGGFDHNAQALRIVTRLERRYAEFDGLNLTWESLEGLVKHNGPVHADRSNQNIPAAIAEYIELHDLEIDTYPGPEAQVAALADDIAYNNHDIDDGLRADLFDLGALRDVPFVGTVFSEVSDRYPGIERGRLINETVRRMIDRMVSDLLAETACRLQATDPHSVENIRAMRQPVVAFSGQMERHNHALKAFLFERMYRHEKVNRMTTRARSVISDLFGLYLSDPEKLPAEWRQQGDECHDTTRTARLVADYIAGMTDRYALDEHTRYFDTVHH